nr:hypothetical protein Itr_chr13CG07730 [Ipomoea trifida]
MWKLIMNNSSNTGNIKASGCNVSSNKSTIAASARIPALSERVSIEFNSSLDFDICDPRFSFFRKSADREIVAEKTKVCLFFLWTLETVMQFCVSIECPSVDLLAMGSMSTMDCNS